MMMMMVSCRTFAVVVQVEYARPPVVQNDVGEHLVVGRPHEHHVPGPVGGRHRGRLDRAGRGGVVAGGGRASTVNVEGRRVDRAGRSEDRHSERPTERRHRVDRQRRRLDEERERAARQRRTHCSTDDTSIIIIIIMILPWPTNKRL